MAPSTYIIGQDSNHERWYVIRTESPRFIAELVEPDEADDGLILEDGEGLRVSQWLDAPQPTSNLKPLLAEIYEEIEHYSANRGIDGATDRATPPDPVLPIEAL